MSQAASFLSWIAERLVGSEVSATATEDARGELISLHVPQARMGRIIGSGGRTVSALRLMLRAAAEIGGGRKPASLRLVEAE